MNNDLSLIIVAHPDDEVIGIGIHMKSLGKKIVVHVTDGAPLDLVDANNNGFLTRDAYARARKQEAITALGLIGVEATNLINFNFADQTTSSDLRRLTWMMVDLIGSYQPDVVFTHAYEGGHPDHDSTAFAVHNACSLLQNYNVRPPIILEFGGYNNYQGEPSVFRFLPAQLSQKICVLSEDEQALKLKMFQCFQTQEKVLALFPLTFETYRFAPEYSFGSPPHSGRLYYERFSWGIRGDEWRKNALNTLEHLGLKSKELKCS